MNYHHKKLPRSLFFVLLVLIISFLCIFGLFRLLGFSPFLSIENAAIRTFQPIIRFSRNTSSAFHKRWILLTNLSSLQEKLDDLENQIRLDKVHDALNDNLIQENQELKSWLGLVRESDYTIETADILYFDGFGMYNFTISKGQINRLNKDYPVILPLRFDDSSAEKLYLIGRIDQVKTNTAHVMSVLDKKSRINAKNLRTQVNGIVEYDANRNQLVFTTLRFDPDLKTGDLIVTNEMSKFPKDLIIGIVGSEEEAAINNKALLQLPFDLLSLSRVGIILP